MDTETLALLTDFGHRDWYVAAMKAVAQTIAPSISIVDITHAIAPGNVDAAAFVLRQCWRNFPSGTVFVVVVDPGVGSQRSPVVVEADGRFFVGPDNGLFGWLDDRVTRVHEIRNETLFNDEVSNTFHGRDIFAPVGAMLASGKVSIAKVGPVHSKLQSPQWPEPEFVEQRAFGHLLYIDHFGNAISNLSRTELEQRYDMQKIHLSLHPRRLPLARTFSDVARGQPLAYIGSGGLLEIGVNGGSAETLLDLRVGQHIEVIADE